MFDLKFGWFQRIADTLDGDIKRWAAGKEGNLRALLSSLQDVCSDCIFCFYSLLFSGGILEYIKLVVVYSFFLHYYVQFPL